MDNELSIHVAAIDYAPLAESPSRANSAAYKKLYPVDIFGLKTSLTIGIGSVLVTFTVVPLFIQQANPYFFDDLSLWTVGVTGVVMILLILLVIWLILRSNEHEVQEKVRIYQFAQRNGFVYIPENVPSSEYEHEPGTLFTEQSAGTTTELFTLTITGMPARIGNYTYSVYNGKSYTDYHRAYMRLTLPRKVPQMLLDSRANDTRIAGIRIESSITNKYEGNQILSLEGDFDKYFTLYCPKEYERDALYIFTPDLMQLLISRAASYDVKIVDDALYIYHKEYWSFTDIATWQQLMLIAEIIHKKMESQTDHYEDERPVIASSAIIEEKKNRLQVKSDKLFKILWVIGVIVVWSVFMIYLFIKYPAH